VGRFDERVVIDDFKFLFLVREILVFIEAYIQSPLLPEVLLNDKELLRRVRQVVADVALQVVAVVQSSQY